MTQEDDIFNAYQSKGGKVPEVASEEIARAEAESKEYLRYLNAGGSPTANSKAPEGWDTIEAEPAPKAEPKPDPLPEHKEGRHRTPVVIAKTFEMKPFIPQSIDEAIRLAEIFVKGEMLPKSYMEGGATKAMGRVLTAMEYGAEVGLLPLQAIQSIAVVNGIATIWGDTQKALVESSGVCEYIQESYEPIGEDAFYIDEKGVEKVNLKFMAVCVTKRKGRKDIIRETFSVADATRAGLWGKGSPWKTHPKRMLRYKARAFALRDTYPDVLKGLTHSREEMLGGDMVDVTNYGDNVMSSDPMAKVDEIFANQKTENETNG